MADITEASRIKFCNERIRVGATMLSDLYDFANETVDKWNAMGGSGWIANQAGDPIVDGATDGRPAISGADVNTVVTRFSEFLTDYNATSKAKLNTVLKVAPEA